MRRGHIALRTCVVCGAKTDKKELVRVVRNQAGSVQVDATGKQPGRGAYLCHKQTCWDRALKKNRLGHTLRGPISSEDKLTLQQYAQQAAEAAPSS